MPALTFRAAQPGDMRFVVDAWASSYRDSYSAGMIQVDDWYAVMIPQIQKAIARPGVRITVAVLPDEAPPVDLAGFIVADTDESPPLVYYAFVKDHYRRGRRLDMPAGVGRQLMEAAGVDPKKPFNYVCETLVVQRMRFSGVIPYAKWKPLLGRFPKHERNRR